MSNPVKYSLGFAFIGNQVLLLNKTHPETQKNKYNGLGGKLEENDTIIAQEIVQGLVTASKEELDLTRVSPDEVIPFVRRISGMQKIALS